MGKTAFHTDNIYMEHNTGFGHPEKADRIRVIKEKIESASYYNDLLLVDNRDAEIKHLEKIHSREYIKRVQNEIENGAQYLDSMDTIVCRKSYRIALRAAGAGLNMCDAIMEGKAQHGFCAVRPPGHHAEEDHAAGFCLFNNIAIAARYLQTKHGIKKIAIVDWDVHHGNGTQHSFEYDDSIYFISTHQFPHYPGTGARQERGLGKGEGFTLNFPMRQYSSDEIFIDAFQEEIIPELHDFKPEIILISAGFDAHNADPLSSIRLTTDMYGEFTKMLLNVAKEHSEGRVIAFLEGGYNLQALAESVDKVMSTFVNFK